jgi:hypothetical protein
MWPAFNLAEHLRRSHLNPDQHWNALRNWCFWYFVRKRCSSEHGQFSGLAVFCERKKSVGYQFLCEPVTFIFWEIIDSGEMLFGSYDGNECLCLEKRSDSDVSQTYTERNCFTRMQSAGSWLAHVRRWGKLSSSSQQRASLESHISFQNGQSRSVGGKSAIWQTPKS